MAYSKGHRTLPTLNVYGFRLQFLFRRSRLDLPCLGVVLFGLTVSGTLSASLDMDVCFSFPRLGKFQLSCLQIIFLPLSLSFPSGPTCKC